jgi:hypothetical protein
MIKIKEKEYDLKDEDEAFVAAIQELTEEIREVRRRL